MGFQARQTGSEALTRQLEQLDGVRMSAAERDRAKAYLRQADAVVETTARAWDRVRSYVRRLRGPSAVRGATAIR